jgi:hypothetical protein
MIVPSGVEVILLKQKEIELFYAYIFNQRAFIVEDINRLKQTLQFRDCTNYDCLELALALNRLVVFDEITGQIRGLLGLY